MPASGPEASQEAFEQDLDNLFCQQEIRLLRFSSLRNEPGRLTGVCRAVESAHRTRLTPRVGAVAQLVRAPDCRSGGYGFEPRRPRIELADCPIRRNSSSLHNFENTPGCHAWCVFVYTSSESVSRTHQRPPRDIGRIHSAQQRSATPGAAIPSPIFRRLTPKLMIEPAKIR